MKTLRPATAEEIEKSPFVVIVSFSSLECGHTSVVVDDAETARTIATQCMRKGCVIKLTPALEIYAPAAEIAHVKIIDQRESNENDS